MGHVSATALWASAVLLLFVLYTNIARKLHRCSIMRKYGCKNPPHYPHLDPFLGYDLYRDEIRSQAEGASFAARRRRFQVCRTVFRFLLLQFMFRSRPLELHLRFRRYLTGF